MDKFEDLHFYCSSKVSLFYFGCNCLKLVELNAKLEEHEFSSYHIEYGNARILPFYVEQVIDKAATRKEERGEENNNVECWKQFIASLLDL